MSKNINLKCLACQKNSSQIIVNAGSKAYNAFKCTFCGLVQTEPMPSSDFLSQYYQGFDFLPPRAEEIESHVEAIKQSLKFFIGSQKGSGSFLDYGGGSGIYCKAADALGWKAELFDLDINMLSFAQSQLGIKFIWNNIEQLSDRTFEVIFAYHVIEHWNDIDNNLLKILSLLEPNGSIIFATPNAKSVEKFARPHHYMNYYGILAKAGLGQGEIRSILDKTDSILCWDPPRHLMAFTPDSLKAIGSRFGLKTEIFVGYNLSNIFEPRRYVFPKLLDQLISDFRRKYIKQKAWAALKTFCRFFQMVALRFCCPTGGEQLYVRYKRGQS